MKKYTLLLVTVTYKPDLDQLDLFIQSFYKYNDLGSCTHLVVVDNSPNDNDGCKQLVSKYDSVSYIPNPSNPGFGASNNVGFHKYDSDFVLFINNDVEFTQSLFRDIIDIMEKNSSIGCVGIHQTGGAPSYFQKITAPKNVDMRAFDERYHFISGAFMFFKSDIFRLIGEFDEHLFMYYEEFDLSERLIKANYSTRYLPQYSFWHKAGGRRVMNEFASLKGGESLIYLCKKYRIDPTEKTKSDIVRWRKLQIYHFVKLNFKEVRKLQRIIDCRKRIIAEFWQQKPKNKLFSKY